MVASCSREGRHPQLAACKRVLNAALCVFVSAYRLKAMFQKLYGFLVLYFGCRWALVWLASKSPGVCAQLALFHNLGPLPHGTRALIIPNDHASSCKIKAPPESCCKRQFSCLYSFVCPWRFWLERALRRVHELAK